jgi:hypothetical protein
MIPFLVVPSAPEAVGAAETAVRRQTGSQTVPQWGRFDLAVPHHKSYANPYEDVTLDVTYTRPDGQTVEFWGFHDGARTWRLRFMPDQTGTWKYSARFSDGSGQVSGTFQCMPSGIPGMISHYEDNPIWFAFGGTKPMVVRSLHVGDCLFADRDNAVTGARWSPAMREAFLDWAQRQGYNMLSIASHYLNRDSDGRGKGWNTPDLWNAEKQQPNPDEFRRLEERLDDLATRKIAVYPFAGFFGRDSDFPRHESKQDLYIGYTLARLGPYWNMMFVVGGPEPRLKGKPFLGVDDVNRLGRRIKELDVFGHLLSVHNPTGDDQFKNADWASYGILQGPKTTDRGKLSRGLLRNHHQARPLYAQETLWPGNKYHPEYKPDDIRKNAFVMMMSATAINLGDMDGNSSSGFSGTADLNRKVQERHDIIKRVWDFFETVPYYRMTPRQDLVDRGYCLAEPGRSYLVYLEEAGTVNLELREGTYDVQWINARDTSDVRAGDSVTAGESLTAPESGDWLLHVTRREPSRADTKPTLVTEGAFADIQIDARGDLHLVYARDDRVYYRRYDSAARQWGDERFTGIAEVPWMARSEPDICVDSRNRPHVFAGAVYAHLADGAWKTMQLAEKLRDTELAIDAGGNLYLVHRGGNHGGFMGFRTLPAGANEWVTRADPDKPLLGRNDHVYPDLAVSPVDQSLHIVYRHGNPKKTAYRRSADGGRTWPVREGITDHEPEAAHVIVDFNGNVYATDGGGFFYRRSEAGWARETQAVEAPRRGQPELAVDRKNTIYCACWGGRYNIRVNGVWTGARTLPRATDRGVIGFVELIGTDEGAYLAWEEGRAGDPDRGMEQASVIIVGRLLPNGAFSGL